jgi:hypothetical protein
MLQYAQKQLDKHSSNNVYHLFQQKTTPCPHLIFICSVRFLEQNAVTSLNSIDGLVVIIETRSVFCEVETKFLNIIEVNVRLQKYRLQTAL